jgi:CHAT domain-containing protein
MGCRPRVRAIAATAAVLCVTLLAGAARHVQAFARRAPSAGQRIVLLEQGMATECTLSRGEEHLYQLALTAGEHVRVIVEQRGIDVVVQARRADGTPIADFQEEIRPEGREQVDVVADAAGIYSLAIKPGPGAGSGSYAIRVDGRRPATDADRALQDARALRTAAAGLELAAKLDEARRLFERALTISEAVLGPDDVFVGVLVFDLAGNALDARDDPRAESLFQRAIGVLEKTWGAEHPYPAMARARLALLQQHAGQGLKAEGSLRQASEVIERTLGTDHPWSAIGLMTQAALRYDAGDFEKAEEIDLRAMAIMERIGRTDDPVYAGLSNNLGEVYRSKGDYARAEELYRRALEIAEKWEGPESYRISTAYQNLASIARERKDNARALDYGTRALSIRERLLGGDHPDIAPLLNNLAVLYHVTGDDGRAFETQLRALRLFERVGGPYDRGALLSVGNMARWHAAAGDIENAIAVQRRADAIVEGRLALNLAVGSERQKLAFAASVSERTDRTISLHLREAPANPDASSLAALVVLQRKGRVLDAMTDSFAGARQRVADAGDRALLDQLNSTTTQLAQLALNAPAQARQDDRPRAIKELETRKERLEVELGERNAEFRAQRQPVTLEAVQAAMPDGAVLLEFAIFRSFDPNAALNGEAYGPPHYAAYVVGKHGAPRGQDLGATDTIDDMIGGLRQALRDPRRTDVKQRARALDEQLMRPLRAFFGDATQLLISPDGELNLVPFEALVDEHHRYLIERYAMSYLTSGRDLLRMQVPRMSRSNPVIVADPLFGEPATASTIYFTPIPGTAEEARAIKAVFPEATLLTGRHATKAALQRMEAPRLLHIASHGFFLRNPSRDTQTPAAAAVNGTRAISSSSITVENPLLRSGVALAGANLTHDPHDPHDGGILTALEASGLNLWGTRLVTLSACDTGVGEVRKGEGVYGLRRAFVLAGAETLVMTLWPVSDYLTRQPMTAYYTGLRAGLGRGDALRRAKLALLNRKDRQHPFYWAGFIQSGEWASLDGKR